MRQPTVLFLSNHISRAGGGVFDAMRSLALSVAEQDRYRPEIMGVYREDFEKDRPLWGSLGIAAFKSVGPSAFGYATKLYESLTRKAPDIVHVHGLWMYSSLAALRWSGLRKPHLVSPHGMLDGWALNHSRWKKRISAAMYEDRHLRRAVCLHALNEAEVDAIRAYGLSNPVCVIPNGVELPPAGRPAESLNGTRTLLYLGRLHPKKGLPALIEAWSRVQNRAMTAGWRLGIAGWDQNGHRSSLEALVASRNVSSSVTFLGPRFGEAKAECFRSASAFILPSLSEGLPMAILEAWAWSLPVLMTAECNLPEGSGNGAALEMEPSPESIAAALDALFSMSLGERTEMGLRGRQLVERQFQWRQAAQVMADVYDWILERGPRPACIRN